MRRRAFVTAAVGLGTGLLAGCTSNTGDSASSGDGAASGDGDSAASGETDGDGTGSGRHNFRLLISDRPAAIDDFDSLTVTFSHARVFGGAPTATATGDGASATGTDDGSGTGAETATAETSTAAEDGGGAVQPEDDEEDDNGRGNGDKNGNGGNDNADNEADENADNESDTAREATDGDGTESEESDDGEDENDDGGEDGFTTFDLTGKSVDLTEVVGEKAMSVVAGTLSPGRYTKIELHAADVTGVVDGEDATVKLPSEKLMLTKPFEVVAGQAVSFVFDIGVTKRGQGTDYILKPVISESGVAGKDVEIEEVEGGEESEQEAEAEDDENEGEQETEDEQETTEAATATAND